MGGAAPRRVERAELADRPGELERAERERLVGHGVRVAPPDASRGTIGVGRRLIE
jgi:hypothetical protein